MASAEIVSNLKLITSGNVPTTSNLGNGELAFGLVGGVAKLYGNVNGTIVDFSDFLKVAPVTSVAGKTGAVTLNKSDVGLGNVDNTADANKSVAQAAALKGTDTRDVNSPPSFYQQHANSMKSVYEFKYADIIEVNSLLPDTYCYVQTLIPWASSSGGLPVQLAAQGYGGTARYAIRSATDASTWGAWKKIATQDEIPSVPVLSVNAKTGNVVLTLGDISSAFVGVDGANVSFNVGSLPTYPGKNTSIAWGPGFGISQGMQENSGIWFDGDQIVMWSPCDRGALNYYDEDNGALIFKIDANGILTRKDGKKALYEGEAGSGNIGSYWAVIPNDAISTHCGGAYISFSFTANYGYDESLIHSAELKDILLASSVNIYRTQTDYASEYPEMDMSELHSHIYNGDGTANGKQIIRGKATVDISGTMKDYDCLLFVYASGTDVYLTIGLVEEDKNTVYMTRDVRLDESDSFPTVVFYLGNL